MSKPSKMEVNAAIETLINRNDDEGEAARAARVVIRYGHDLKESSNVQLELFGSMKSDSSTISGHTTEMGQVDLKDDAKDESFEKILGVHKDRVGHYRLWKQRENLLVFHHFWKSSIVTQSEDDDDPEEYYLSYYLETLEPESLSVKRIKVIFSLGRHLIFSKVYLEPIYGRVDKKHLRGQQIKFFF